MNTLYYKKIFKNLSQKLANAKFRNLLNKRNIHIWVILFIVLFSAWLKLNHFTDWLHYEFDQSRDNIIVSEAIKNGPASLPLVGPKADGTSLRVGPFYYYFEYISALIFGDTPQGHAYLVPIFSLVSILILYLLLKKFFNTFISLGLAYLYSISFFLLIYARFGWNPNILPFFIMSGIYCLLKATEKKSKYPGKWFIASTVFFCVATQLHFVAFFALPIFMIACLIYERPKFSWRAWLAVVFVIITLYSPAIVSDIILKGYNSKEFIRALSTKTEQKKSFAEKTISTMRSGGENYVLILSGDDRIWTPKITFEKGWINLSCKNYCKKTSPWLSYASLIFFIFGALLIVWQVIKRKKPIAIIGLFFMAVFLIFTRITTEPRFYLLAAFLPFFFLGNIIDLIWRRNALSAKVIFIIFIILFSYTNISRAIQRFSDLEEADRKLVPVHSDRILKEPERVSLKQFKSISRYMFASFQENKLPVFFYSEPLYWRSFKYLTERMGAPSVGQLEKKKTYLNANNFVILRTRKAGSIKSYLEYYEVVYKKEFGTITLFQLTPKIDKITAIDAPPTLSSIEYISVPWQITWQDALNQL